MNVNLNGRWMGAVALAVGCVGLTAGCTLADGQPWGWVDGELTVEAPALDGEAFVVEAAEVGPVAVRLVAEAEAEPPEGEDDHGHAHGSVEDVAPVDGAGLLVVLAFEGAVGLGEPAALAEVPVTAQARATRLEVDLEAVRMTGSLVRDQTTVPLEVRLETVHLDAPVDLTVGHDSPEHQHIEVRVLMPDHLFEHVDLDGLEGDQAVVVAPGQNAAAYREIVETFESEGQLVVEHLGQGHAHHGG